MKLNVVVFLYSFNDIDHIAPVAWALLNKGHRVRAVMLDPEFDGTNDPRIAFLERNPQFSRHPSASVLDIPWCAWLFKQTAGETRGKMRRGLRKLLRITGLSISRACAVLVEWQTDVCIFEWGSTGGRNRKEFHTAARKLGLRTICLPHGMNIYTEPAINQSVKAAIESRDMNTIRGDYADYDAFVLQTEFHRDMEIQFGVPKDIAMAMGSARYCPEWVRVLKGLYPAFVPSSSFNPDFGEGVKVVFMLPHWTYNVDQEATLALIEALARNPNVHLVVKDHTRGTGGLPDGMRASFKNMIGAETAGEAASVALIAWSNVVICFGSSIALEAHLQSKVLINPVYLHSNKTIFEETASSIETKSLDETLDAVMAVQSDVPPKVPEGSIQELYRIMIFGGREHLMYSKGMSILSPIPRPLRRCSRANE